ncbi:MAG: hypothetical protein KatS3mg027_1791 [Bacteroidia bacterium]|nr:MAG: hypothetical protein KatS3mg027_1791 [Bacteroidia bacterium]
MMYQTKFQTKTIDSMRKLGKRHIHSEYYTPYYARKKSILKIFEGLVFQNCKSHIQSRCFAQRLFLLLNVNTIILR